MWELLCIYRSIVAWPEMTSEQWTFLGGGTQSEVLRCPETSLQRHFVSGISPLKGEQFCKVRRRILLIRHPDARYGESNTECVS